MRSPALIAAAILCLAAGCSPVPTEDELTSRARALQDAMILIDTHDDIEPDFGSDANNPCGPTTRQVDVPKMEQGGLDVAFFIVYVAQTPRSDSSYAAAKAAAQAKFDGIHRAAEVLCPDKLEIAYTVDDVERIHATGKRGVAIGIENGFVVGTDLSLVEQYARQGARYITLAHNGHNDIADSAQPNEAFGDVSEEHGGISAFGEAVIDEMNRVGIMVDVSHISKQAMLEAAQRSQAPVIASHSSVRALADHPRNMDDEQLLALQANGGVIQITAVPEFIRAVPPEKTAFLDSLVAVTGDASADRPQPEQAMLDQADARWPGPTVTDFVDHIQYAVDLIGIDHVGISSDFDGGGGLEGWNDAGETLSVTRELVRRGYSDEEIAKLWGRNLLRVWREVERVAASRTAAPDDVD